MLKLIVPLVMGLAGAGIGVGAGLFLAPAEHSESGDHDGGHDTHAAKPEKAAHNDGHSDDHKDDHKDGSGDGHGSLASEAYVKLHSQFVVPIVKHERVVSMVVLSLSLEVQPGTEDKVYALEPKLRDAFLQVLFDHANMGGFQGRFTDSEMLTVLRGSLRDVARRELGGTVQEVLIQDIVRQDV